MHKIIYPYIFLDISFFNKANTIIYITKLILVHN